MLAAAAAGTLAAGLTAGGWMYAASWPTSQIFGATLIAGRDPSEIALTFDDGPNTDSTARLLEVLARHDVRATFFAIGSRVREQPALAREIVAAGHLLGNHTMHHPRLSFAPAAEIRRELADCNGAIEDVTGMPVRFFRPPFGWRRPYVLRAARDLDLTPVLWNITSHDWTPIGAETILESLNHEIGRNRRRGHGSNVLLHDGGHLAQGTPRTETVRAVDRLLAVHAGTSSRFVTVDAWLGGGAG